MGKIRQWETKTINRSLIKIADYNPRKLSNKAEKKLKENLESKGFMGGIIWNSVTGNLVSGHQRLKLLDKDNKTKDYMVLCTVVELSLEDEKKQNIFLNNSDAQGEFDYIKLEELMGSLEFSEETGFDKSTSLQMFGINNEMTKEEYEELAKSSEYMKNFSVLGRGKKDKDSDDFYCVLVFKEATERDKVLNSLGLEPNKFYEAKEFLNAVAGLKND